MKLELHLLQNFAPSNLNRDDTGAPKDCDLGGVRRARISSQCYKRAIREAFGRYGLLSDSERASRTKRLVDAVAAKVASSDEHLDEARRAVVRALGGAKIAAEDGGEWKTQYLLFLPTRVVDEIAVVVRENWAVLATTDGPRDESDANRADHTDAAPPVAQQAKRRSKKQEKADAREGVPAAVRERLGQILSDASRTPEIALFGRMIADSPDWNVEAACQVAHAISTHRVSMEFDFYTAIDDLRREDTAGSDMMGTIPFNSACFYRYLVVDIMGLIANLGGGEAARAQARSSVEALLRASIVAVPTGKQNSMAAHNPPSFILTEVRDGGAPRSLANAFVDPVRPRAGRHGDLVSQSILRLVTHSVALDDVYGARGRRDLSFCAVDPDGSLISSVARTFSSRAQHRATIDDLIAASVEGAFGTRQ
jgi:CRISPR system Cascade subunit CasC